MLEMIFQGEMNIFHIVSYKSLGFGALILGIQLILIIKTFFTDVIYINFFNIPCVYNTKK